MTATERLAGTAMPSLSTPALLVDLDILDANVAAIRSHLSFYPDRTRIEETPA